MTSIPENSVTPLVEELSEARFVVEGSEVRLAVRSAWSTQTRVLSSSIAEALALMTQTFGPALAATHQVTITTSADGMAGGGVVGTDVRVMLPDLTHAVESTRSFWGCFLIHELFHLWNGPKLFETESGDTEHIPEYWVSEGFTQHYQYILGYRLGWLTERQWLATLEEIIGRYLRADFPVSIREAGRDKGAFRSLVYDGGALVALAINAAIFEATEGTADLDTAMAELIRQCSSRQHPTTFEDIVRVIAEIAFIPPAALADRINLLVDSKQKIDVASILRSYGYTGRVHEDIPALKDVIRKLLHIKSLSLSGRQVVARFEDSVFEVGDVLVQFGDVVLHHARDLQFAAKHFLDAHHSSSIHIVVRRNEQLIALRLPIPPEQLERESVYAIAESDDRSEMATSLRQGLLSGVTESSRV